VVSYISGYCCILYVCGQSVIYLWWLCWSWFLGFHIVFLKLSIF